LPSGSLMMKFQAPKGCFFSLWKNGTFNIVRGKRGAPFGEGAPSSAAEPANRRYAGSSHNALDLLPFRIGPFIHSTTDKGGPH